MLLHGYNFFSLLIQMCFVTIACKGVARSVFNRLQDEFTLLLEQTISVKIVCPLYSVFCTDVHSNSTLRFVVRHYFSI